MPPLLGFGDFWEIPPYITLTSGSGTDAFLILPMGADYALNPTPRTLWMTQSVPLMKGEKRSTELESSLESLLMELFAEAAIAFVSSH